jgi:hypothetical protein
VAQIVLDVAVGSAICGAREWLSSVLVQEAVVLRTVLEAAFGVVREQQHSTPWGASLRREVGLGGGTDDLGGGCR